jgi:putative membrane protein
MKYLLWLLKAAIFFTLFAFALNNQHDATVHFFFGTAWRAPLVLVVLAAFAAGLVVGALGMVPGWWKHRAAAARGPPSFPKTWPFPLRPSRPRLRLDLPAVRRMDFDLSWLLWGLPIGLRAGLAGLALRPAPAAHREPAGAQGLLPRPELPAQRAAGPGHRRLHRGGTERPRHLRSCTSRWATCSAAAASTSAPCACTSTCSRAAT